MDKKEFEKIRAMGYGEKAITDENGKVIATSCKHYYNELGECIFCGAIKFDSYLHRELYGRGDW